MYKWLKHPGWRWLALAAGGTAFFLNGCDPTLQATAENGIITGANSLLTAFFQALMQLAQEANKTNTTTGTTTTQAIIDVAQRIFA